MLGLCVCTTKKLFELLVFYVNRKIFNWQDACCVYGLLSPVQIAQQYDICITQDERQMGMKKYVCVCVIERKREIGETPRVGLSKDVYLFWHMKYEL